MNKSRFLAFSFFLALSGMGAAQAQAPALAAGTYKLAISANAPCDLTITADGGVTQGADCATSTHLTKWKASGSSYQLITASGETYAVLKPNGENLEGVTFADNHKLVLSH
jgi:hypothetical protein